MVGAAADIEKTNPGHNFRALLVDKNTCSLQQY